MKIQFDKNQGFQLEAIQSIIDLFEGQNLNKSDFEFSSSAGSDGSLLYAETGVGNRLALSEEELLSNLIRVQTNNRLRPEEISKKLEKLSFCEEGDEKGDGISTDFPNYSIEMETGTGKTYVYLRSIFELNKVYGFKKFVIVVPSVAIREGVMKNLQITFDHFQELYGNPPIEYMAYNSGHLAILDNFAKSNTIQILVINIDSFTRDANIIIQTRETGLKPMEYIRQSNPIVILDEPQNMETNIRRRAIAHLNPLFVLRFSATHKNRYNLIYKLDPVRAYDLGLVKQIEVDAVAAKNEDSSSFIGVEDIKTGAQSLAAKLSILVSGKNGVQKMRVTAKVGDDLYRLSRSHESYRKGFIVNHLDAENGYIEFSNGTILHRRQAVGELSDQILRAMVDACVENHFKKEKELKGRGIKVLSIFFIDRVANYRSYDQEGRAVKGKFARWFEESFEKWQNESQYKALLHHPASAVHDGYFSQDKGRMKDSKEGRPGKADDETFRLIMRDKEKLLDLTTPLRFIFSHSALREGWDNPNVFQICTLNETKSDMKKRQEIGRGLRLCVDQTGVRNTEREVNRLTIVANEAYDSFSKALQKEMEEDCGVQFQGRIRNARARARVTLKSNWQKDPLFLELWEKINHASNYQVKFDSQELIANCTAALQAMPPIEKPVIYREKNIAKVSRTECGNLHPTDRKPLISQEIPVNDIQYDIPDMAAFIQSRTGLTRESIIEILILSGRLSGALNQPLFFMESAARIINEQAKLLKIRDIHFKKTKGQAYDLSLFKNSETERYLENLIPVKNTTKTLYNFTAIDSLHPAERKFAEACEARGDILYYLKLPEAFQIKTPFGSYHPGWALIKKEKGSGKNIYLVADLKAGKSAYSKAEKTIKSICAEKHFNAIGGVHYKAPGSVEELED